MNIILFEPGETEAPLSLDDPRARHVVEVLRRKPGDDFDVGVVDGPRGKATVVSVDNGQLALRFHWGEEPPPLEPLSLVIGLPRPQTARKVLEEATALGVQAMHFVITERGDPGYGQSRLWSTGEWRRHVVAGVEQAFSTRTPLVTHNWSLAEVLNDLASGQTKLVLDNYEAHQSLGEASARAPVVLAIGPEPGWSRNERELLRGAGFAFAHLGERVLRVETACVAAIALVRAKLSSM